MMHISPHHRLYGYHSYSVVPSLNITGVQQFQFQPHTNKIGATPDFSRVTQSSTAPGHSQAHYAPQLYDHHVILYHVYICHVIQISVLISCILAFDSSWTIVWSDYE